MKCIICDDFDMQHYFNKIYYGRQYEFVKCPRCGMVIDKTIYEMDSEDWEKVNNIHIRMYNPTDKNNELKRHENRLIPQAGFISDLYLNGIISKDDRVVDYGCGDGLLTRMVDNLLPNYAKDRFSLIGKYEKYLQGEGNDYYEDSDMLSESFDVVISLAVLEHMIGFDDIDGFFCLVNNTGMAIIHTLICEEVPQDPEWFYIWEPFHCTLWTNKAMEQVFNRYGFVGCSYHTEAKIWIFYKDLDKYEYSKSKRDMLRGSSVYKRGFIDYWKQKPYR